MATAKVTSQGQVTIPVDVRRAMGIETGTRIEFVMDDAGACELVVASGSVLDLAGTVATPSSLVTLEDMDDAIAAGRAK